MVTITQTGCASAWLACGLLLIAGAADASGNDTQTGQRQSFSRQIPSGGRDGAAGETREDRYDALLTEGSRTRPSVQGAAKPATGSAQSAAIDDDFWFYEADVRLLHDDDRDGYFRTIDLLFDVDTYYDEIDVYAVAYLSYEGGPWNEYAETDVFTLFGATGDDEFGIVTDLDSGYPRGDYDILIELYDPYDGVFLADFGPEDTSELGYLPLEDYDRDTPVHIGGGGASGPATVLWLSGLAWFARRKRLNACAVPSATLEMRA